jgi:hypothetical protein
VLKRQFSALIPAFDPRPGRTNVNQTSDLDIPPPTDKDLAIAASLAARGAGEKSKSPDDSSEKELFGKILKHGSTGGFSPIDSPLPAVPKIQLVLKGPGVGGVSSE